MNNWVTSNEQKCVQKKKTKIKIKINDKTTIPDIRSLIHPPKKGAAIKLKAWNTIKTIVLEIQE